jgi:hypothetical protein
VVSCEDLRNGEPVAAVVTAGSGTAHTALDLEEGLAYLNGTQSLSDPDGVEPRFRR